MEIKKEISSEGEATLEIEVPVEETAPRFTAALEKFRREANIPGFRPGRVPLDLVRKRYGRGIASETAEQLARDYLSKALSSEKLEPGGRIDVNLIEYGEDKPLRFKVNFPVQPEVELSNYKGLRVMINEAEVTEGDVDRQIEAFRRKHALLRSVDTPAPAEARLTLEVQEVDPSGLPLIGRPVEEMTFEFGTDSLGVGSDEQLYGIRAGEKRLIKIRPAPGDLAQAPYQPQIITPAQEAQGNPAHGSERYILVEVERVEVSELPELDDDFAKTVNLKLTSVELLRQWTRLNLMGYVGVAAQRWLEKGVIDRLIEDNPFPVPRSIVEITLNEVADSMKLEGEARKEFIEKHYHEAERDYRWVILRDAVAEREEIDVTDEDVEAEITRMAEQSGDTVEKIRRKLKANNSLDRLRRQMFERLVVEFLAENAVVEKRMMDLDEFLRVNADG